MVNETPFEDVRFERSGFSIPDLKWRELVFTGALREEAGAWVRDPSRPMSPFGVPDLLPEGVRFRVLRERGRVLLVRLPETAAGG